jgi:hypothetical protein
MTTVETTPCETAETLPQWRVGRHTPLVEAVHRLELFVVSLRNVLPDDIQFRIDASGIVQVLIPADSDTRVRRCAMVDAISVWLGIGPPMWRIHGLYVAEGKGWQVRTYAHDAAERGSGSAFLLIVLAAFVVLLVLGVPLWLALGLPGFAIVLSIVVVALTNGVDDWRGRKR